VVIIDLGWAQELFNRLGLFDRIEFRPRAGVSAALLEERLRNSLPPEYLISEPSERSEQTSRMFKSLEFNLTALSGISLLVGAVLVATSLYTSVIQRRQIIALLRSLGASSGQITRAVLMEASLLGLLGGILGVAAGFIGAGLALANVRSTIAVVLQGIPSTEIEFDSGFVLLGILLGFITSIAASLYPLLEARKTPPVQVLRPEKPALLSLVSLMKAAALIVFLVCAAIGLLWMPPIQDLPYAALAAALLLLIALLVAASPILDLLARWLNQHWMHFTGMSVRLAAAALAAGRKRSAWAAGAIGMSVALAVAITTMVDSFRQTMIDWSNQSMQSDLWIRPMSARTGVQVGRLSPEIVGVLVKHFREESIDPYHVTDAVYQGNRIELGAGNLAVVRNYGGVPFRDGRKYYEVITETLEKHGAIVNESFANKYKVSRGDILHLQVPGGEIEREVTGVFHDYSSQEVLVIIDRNDFLQRYPHVGPTGVSVYLPEGQEAEAARRQVRDLLGSTWTVEILLNRELRHQVLEVFDRTFAITTALQMVSTIVAVIAVLTVLFTLVDERRHDLALLRALGASPAQVVGVVIAQAGLLGLTGSSTGIAAGLFIGWILVNIVNLQSFGWTLQFLLPWGMIFSIAFWVVPASLLAGFAPALSAIRLQPAEVLRDEV
jgi:putative ABC transport system permease protein